MTYTYMVKKTIHPYGPKDPVEENFEITIRAKNQTEATVRAANIGKELGLLLVATF